MAAVSIIIPYHNTKAVDRRSMLDELIASIPDRPDIEILAVDDHSEVEWVPSVDPDSARLHLLRNKADWRFAGTARNTGLEAATGKFVLFADSDDRYITQTLDALIDHATGNDIDDVVFYRIGSFLEGGGSGNRHDYIDRHLDRYLSEGINPLRYIITPSVKMIRRSFIEGHALRFGDSRFANDHTFAISLFVADPVFSMWDETIYLIREGNAGLTTHPGLENVRTRLHVAKSANMILRNACLQETPLVPAFWHGWKRFPLRLSLDFIRSALEGHVLLPPASRIFRHFYRKVAKRKPPVKA